MTCENKVNIYSALLKLVRILKSEWGLTKLTNKLRLNLRQAQVQLKLGLVKFLTLYAMGVVQSARIKIVLRLLFSFIRKHAIKLFDFS